MELNVIKQRIKKLLALSSSPNDAEASLAMQKCKELMEKYDIRTIDVDVVTGEVAVEATSMGSPYKKHQAWETALGAGIAGCFDAKCCYHEGTNGVTIVFVASKTDSIFIIDLFKRTRRIISKSAKEYVKDIRAKAAIEYSFKMGAINTLTQRLKDIYTSDSKGLVVYKEDAIKKRLKEMFSVVQEKAPPCSKDKEAYLAGMEKANTINLGKSLTAQRGDSFIK